MTTNNSSELRAALARQHRELSRILHGYDEQNALQTRPVWLADVRSNLFQQMLANRVAEARMQEWRQYISAPPAPTARLSITDPAQ